MTASPGPDGKLLAVHPHDPTAGDEVVELLEGPPLLRGTWEPSLEPGGSSQTSMLTGSLVLSRKNLRRVTAPSPSCMAGVLMTSTVSFCFQFIGNRPRRSSLRGQYSVDSSCRSLETAVQGVRAKAC